MRRLCGCLLAYFVLVTAAVSQGNHGGTLYLGVNQKLLAFSAARNGKLVPANSTNLPGGWKPFGVSGHPKSRVLYVLGRRDKSWALFTLSLQADNSIGKLLQGPLPCDFGYLQVHPSGRYLYNVFQSGFAVRYLLDKDGKVKPASMFPRIRNMWTGLPGFTWSADGRFLYVASNDALLDSQFGTTCVVRFRRSDGVLKPIPNTTTEFGADGATAMFLSRDGRRAVLLCLNRNMVMYRRNPASGLISPLRVIPYSPPDMSVTQAVQGRNGSIYALGGAGILDVGHPEAPDPKGRVLYRDDWLRSIVMGEDCIYAMRYENPDEQHTKSSVISVPLHGRPYELPLDDWVACAFFRPSIAATRGPRR